MIKLWTILPFLTLLIATSCSNEKVMAEFNAKKEKNEITIILKEATTVEKKKSLNNLFARYLNSAPEDSLMLDVVNQYTLYYLFEMGYTNLLVQASDDDELPELTPFTYQIEMGTLSIREFKYHESVSDSTDSNTEYVKLKGIETTLKATVTPIENNNETVQLSKQAIAIIETTESQEGEFSTSRNLKDIVVGNKEGSTKYLHNVNRLEDGIFENQCLEIAYQIAKNIDEKIVWMYKKQRKAK